MAAAKPALATLRDVDVTGLADKGALLWDAATSKFKPADVATQAELDAHASLGMAAHGGIPTQKFKAGRWYGPPSNGAQLTMVLNRLNAVPYWLPAGQAFDRIGCNVSTLAASSVVRLGLYADDGTLSPGALIADYGTVDTSSTGGKEIVIAWTVPTTGWYWFASCAQGGAPAIIASNFQAPSGDADSVSTSAGCYQDTVSGALPGTFAATSFSVGSIGRPVLRAA